MKLSLCPCGAPAKYSVCVLVSSLSLRPRLQKCSSAQVFCVACVQRIVMKDGAIMLAGCSSRSGRRIQPLVNAFEQSPIRKVARKCAKETNAKVTFVTFVAKSLLKNADLLGGLKCGKR